ncbi:sensor histidine kinase [Seongchinamella unica]|uniref:Sensor histidine kinase n=1 Tax=Seongchinamella unica TaxID=2547392 RepID=A0A4R5LUU2_9GAMM|nr:histidine kinase [Seongchinamella unica]TDG15194.1 sensor histidine kinase [Seongchinamella unica]
MIRPLVQVLHKNRDARFWFCQLVGWSGYSIATFLTITLVDGDLSWIHVGHILMSAVLGILVSWPLRLIYHSTFYARLGVRLSVAAASVIISSALWTVLRILVFAWLVDEPPLWKEVNYWYFGSLFVFLSWTVLYYGIKYYDLLTTEHQKLLEETAGKRNEQMLRLQAEAAAQDAQIRMLHYQLAPHFLFNTLNAINAMVRLGDIERAQEMIQLLGDFLRHALKKDAVESVTLDEEIDSLKLYLDIEKVRFEDRLSLEFDLEPASLSARVPALLLQPLIENAMKYAISESEDGGTLSISSSVDGDQLLLEVADTGPGFEPDMDDDGRGIGLRNVMDRLKTLYGDDQSFTLSQNSPTGLKVVIALPLQFDSSETGSRQGHEELSVAQA